MAGVPALPAASFTSRSVSRYSFSQASSLRVSGFCGAGHSTVLYMLFFVDHCIVVRWGSVQRSGAELACCLVERRALQAHSFQLWDATSFD